MPIQMSRSVIRRTFTVKLWPAVSGRSSPSFLNTAGCLSSVVMTNDVLA